MMKLSLFCQKKKGVVGVGYLVVSQIQFWLRHFNRNVLQLTWCHTGAWIANLCVPNWPHVEFIFHPWLGRLLEEGQMIRVGNLKSRRRRKNVSAANKNGRNHSRSCESFWLQSRRFKSFKLSISHYFSSSAVMKRQLFNVTRSDCCG